MDLFSSLEFVYPCQWASISEYSSCLSVCCHDFLNGDLLVCLKGARQDTMVTSHARPTDRLPNKYWVIYFLMVWNETSISSWFSSMIIINHNLLSISAFKSSTKNIGVSLTLFLTAFVFCPGLSHLLLSRGILSSPLLVCYLVPDLCSKREN